MVSPWIAGALGWAFFGPLGGLFGYAAGSLFNAAQRDSAKPPTRSQVTGTPWKAPAPFRIANDHPKSCDTPRAWSQVAGLGL